MRAAGSNWPTGSPRRTIPLTARVMVNRVWQHHFGRGIVATPSNFGTRGDPPSHPELLDWLTATFVEHGWSIKSLHRLIMQSKTYQLASDSNSADEAIDPANQWYWRFNRLRLDAEAIRDAMLDVSGVLDFARPGPHPFPPIREWHWTQHFPFKADYPSNHRSVYLMTQRLHRHPFLGLFDGPDTNTTTDVRSTSTVPLQALYLMNDKFMRDTAGEFARSPLPRRPRSAGSDCTRPRTRFRPTGVATRNQTSPRLRDRLRPRSVPRRFESAKSRIRSLAQLRPHPPRLERVCICRLIDQW